MTQAKSYRGCPHRKTGADSKANQFYQSADSTQKNKYRHNLSNHEYEHCSGLAHTDDDGSTPMSAVYYFPGPRFDNYLNPTAAQLYMYEDFEPLN